jgi:phosphatidylinositol kinase/protein kinase (PI-3  family)
VASPQTAIEALIHINNQLRQPEAAVGVLTYAQKHLAMELKESWYEKLCRCGTGCGCLIGSNTNTCAVVVA